jgi:L-serine dehydratase
MAAFTSTFDLFKIGIGPSSSHTMGPMTAACRFARELEERDVLARTARVSVALYGSLALTGRGHATDTAIILGLAGHLPAEVDPDAAAGTLDEIRASKQLALLGRHRVGFHADDDIEWRMRDALAFHPNGMTFVAYDVAELPLHRATFFSVGGGFIVTEEESMRADVGAVSDSGVEIPLPFATGHELLVVAAREGLSIADVMLRNECALRGEREVRAGLDRIAAAMNACIDRGLHQQGVLPGGLNVKRRAATLKLALERRELDDIDDPLIAMDWINTWALAVNEENAAGGKVVTAPTNGAAGVVPAVLRYFQHFYSASREHTHTFLLTAAAIGSLYKRNASISAAEVGCQGEIGVACSMAAAGLTAAQGGTNEQIENAAEIGMEHNLGLTCDPIRGLVQIPCIERNATGAVKAVDAARLALMGDGTHHVTLDQVIETMRRTGEDMRDSYKETSLGGLAVNVPEC